MIYNCGLAISKNYSSFIFVVASKIENGEFWQEQLIYKPDERVWIHLGSSEKDSYLPKIVLNFQGTLYLIGTNDTFTFDFTLLTTISQNYSLLIDNMLDLSQISVVHILR